VALFFSTGVNYDKALGAKSWVFCGFTEVMFGICCCFIIFNLGGFNILSAEKVFLLAAGLLLISGVTQVAGSCY